MSTPMDDNFDNFNPAQEYINFDDKAYYGAVDPRLLSSPHTPLMNHEHAHEHFNQGNDCIIDPSTSDYNLFPHVAPQSNIPFFDMNDSLHSYEPMRHQLLGHRRSVSVPPEDLIPDPMPPPPPPTLVFHRGGTPLGDSMITNKSNTKRVLRKSGSVQKRQQNRHAPYPISPNMRLGIKRSHTQPDFAQQGPTSAPAQIGYLQEEIQVPQAVMQRSDVRFQASPQFTEFGTSAAEVKDAEFTDLDALAFGPRTQFDTAVLGMLGFAERLSRDCDAMRVFLARGFQGVGEDEIERERQEIRASNYNISNLQDKLETLPLPKGKSAGDIEIPSSGQEIKELSAEQIHALLEAYDIPFALDMFLHDKKLAYLRYVGGSRSLMHLVLD